MELFRASWQWANRPADQRFGSIDELVRVTKEYASTARDVIVPFSSLRADVGENNQIVLTGKKEAPSVLSHWAFGQLARYLNVPVDFLRQELKNKPTLVVQILNTLAKEKFTDERGGANLLFHENGQQLVRSITTDSYNRIWNYEVAEKLLPAKEDGWRVPPARPALEDQPGTRRATAEDVLNNQNGGGGLSIKVGDLIAPAGVYASDHDMFIFLINEQNRINDGSEGGLSRGVFVSNSEVGAGSLRMTSFLYRHVCGNHIVWGAKDVYEVAIRHKGMYAFQNAIHAFQAVMLKYGNDSVSDLEATIKKAKTVKIATTKEDVLETLFGNKKFGLGKEQVELAYDAVLPEVDGDPRTVWGYTQGLTRLSQATPYLDIRTKLEQSSRSILQLASK